MRSENSGHTLVKAHVVRGNGRTADPGRRSQLN